MTTAEFEAMDAPQTIALLPVGATEQHGPHLPVNVDSAINAGILKRALGAK
jgi:creatinine amidohydrolase